MSNYNTQLQSNNTDLQEVLELLQAKAAGGEQATPEISVASNGLITATAGAKSSTHQLAFQPAKTITPTTASQIAVSSGYYTGGNVIVAAIPSQYIVPSGTSTITANGTYNVKNYASAVVNVAGGSGDTSIEDAMVTGTLTEYTNSRVSSIGRGAFAYASLTSVNFPNVTTIGGNAFNGCPGLTTVSFPVATTIGSNAFYNCQSLTTVIFPVATTTGSNAFFSCPNLTTVSFPVATTIDSNAFFGCSGLTTVSFPNVITIGNYAFNGCSGLTTVSFPVATTIGSNAFYNCQSLTTVSFPVATTIGSNAFYHCYRLTTVSFPNVTTIGNYAFYNCQQSLTTVNFPVVTTIGSSAFRNCYNLKSLYLTGSSLCTLSNSNAFTSTPIGGYSKSAGTYGSIYVPASLLTSYQAATNWAYFSSRFVAFDGGDATLITFTIHGSDYQAEEGMTWGEWVESDYNNGRYYISGTQIYDSITGQSIKDNFFHNVILNNFNYELSSGGGSN